MEEPSGAKWAVKRAVKRAAERAVKRDNTEAMRRRGDGKDEAANVMNE